MYNNKLQQEEENYAYMSLSENLEEMSGKMALGIRSQIYTKKHLKYLKLF